MIAKDSSSSAASRSDLFRLDLGDRLPPLPKAFHAGRDLDLLEPIALFDPAGDVPPPTAGELLTPRPEVARALGDAN
ncbi:MAG: hypothetical protein AAFY88_15255 [Acidobacteriota bacterium]